MGNPLGRVLSSSTQISVAHLEYSVLSYRLDFLVVIIGYLMFHLTQTPAHLVAKPGWISSAGNLRKLCD